MMKISKSDSSAAGHYEDGSGIYGIRSCSNGKSYIGENKDIIKAVLAKTEYLWIYR